MYLQKKYQIERIKEKKTKQTKTIVLSKEKKKIEEGKTICLRLLCLFFDIFVFFVNSFY